MDRSLRGAAAIVATLALFFAPATQAETCRKFLKRCAEVRGKPSQSPSPQEVGAFCANFSLDAMGSLWMKWADDGHLDQQCEPGLVYKALVNAQRDLSRFERYREVHGAIKHRDGALNPFQMAAVNETARREGFTTIAPHTEGCFKTAEAIEAEGTWRKLRSVIGRFVAPEDLIILELRMEGYEYSDIARTFSPNGVVMSEEALRVRIHRIAQRLKKAGLSREEDQFLESLEKITRGLATTKAFKAVRSQLSEQDQVRLWKALDRPIVLISARDEISMAQAQGYLGLIQSMQKHLEALRVHGLKEELDHLQEQLVLQASKQQVELKKYRPLVDRGEMHSKLDDDLPSPKQVTSIERWAAQRAADPSMGSPFPDVQDSWRHSTVSDHERTFQPVYSGETENSPGANTVGVLIMVLLTGALIRAYRKMQEVTKEGPRPVEWPGSVSQREAGGHGGTQPGASSSSRDSAQSRREPVRELVYLSARTRT
jgi:hypothetical protein